MLPDKEEAESYLHELFVYNPGPWVDHSLFTGLAARNIAEKCAGLDSGRAFVLGMLHDIGRGAQQGISTTPQHVYRGYQMAERKGWDEVARISLTHSYPLKEREISENPDEEEQFIRNYIVSCTFDDYDRLIQLCDALALPQGFCILEKRFVDVARRYGVTDFTVDRWNATFAVKESFEKKMGCSVYDVLPGIKETTFIDFPVWKPHPWTGALS